MNRSLRNVFFLWLGIFILINLAFVQRENTNTFSRYATLLSLVEDGTFSIDRYQHMTVDWAKSPQGHYYSNKAPGPVYLAYPLYWVMDKWITRNDTTGEQRDISRDKSHWQVFKILSFLLQCLPYAILSYFLLRFLALQYGLSKPALLLTLLALLFGHTAVLFMNTFFGHGMAAVFVLGLTMALLKGRWGWVGFCFGWAMMIDFQLALCLPVLLVILWLSQKARGKALAYLVAGGIVPGMLWVIYYVSCFGSPFVLAHRYINPELIDPQYAMWGIFNSLPNIGVIGKLLFGMSRGILWTQPWVLVLSVFGVLFYCKNSKAWSGDIRLFWFAFISLIMLLALVSSFNGWHGGNATGPRYLSPIFPAFAVLLGLVYEKFSPRVKNTLWVTVLLSCFFFVLVFSTGIHAEPERLLWPYYLKLNFIEPTSTSLLRCCSLAGLFVFGLWWTFIKGNGVWKKG